MIILGAELITAVVKENNMEAFMSLEDTFVKAYPHYKSSWRLLHIVAVYGTAEMIVCMMRWKRIDWDRQHTIHEELCKLALKSVNVKEATALYLATCVDRTEIVRSLVKLAGEDSIRSCLQGLTFSIEMEHVFMLELADRLRQKHAGLKPTIVPGHQNEGNGTRSRVFIVYSVSVVQTEDYDFNGLGLVKLRNPYVLKKAKTSSSGETVLSQMDAQRVKEAIRTHCDRLWLRHSNLNIITGRYVKTNRNGSNKDEACVLLYCSTKGVIPLGEEEFPRTLCIKNDNRINVVVREGFFRFGGYMTDSSSRRHSTLKMGCEIGRLTPQYDASGNRIPNSCGTLGPFVLYNNNPGFISCSHVFFDMPTNAYALNFSAQQIVEVVQPSTDSTASVNNTACGVVARAVFAPNHPTSIDAAVVVLTDRSRVPSAGHFSNQHRSSYINAGFNELPEYNNALTLGRSDVNTLPSKPTVIKFGSKTDVTRGALSVVGTDVRPFAKKLGVSGSSDKVLMKNQYLVTGIYPSMDFFDGGDSGSAVFCQDVSGQLVCVGMAIGHCVLNDYPYKAGIVTPIDAILQALGPNITLATFP
ncbi:uncharacterized protein [Argopecten irradians]|uniref:uncharacterized protein n=1 Tax=Argopecten irradians TaxID=31199 RepID=UPI00371EBEC0